MCGRYTLRTSLKSLFKQLDLIEMPELEPRYNIAPSQTVATIRSRTGTPGRELAWLRWGLIPPWSKDPQKGPAPINARAETVAEKPLFREPFRSRRCLVLADGYYEWKKLGGRKQPYYLHLRDGSPFAFAGLWQRWEKKGDETIESCTILTTTANDVSRPVHARMPVLLDPADYRTWLDPELHDPAALTPLLGPYPSHQMIAEPVSLRVNNPRSDGPDLVVPVDPCDSASSESLFPGF